MKKLLTILSLGVLSIFLASCNAPTPTNSGHNVSAPTATKTRTVETANKGTTEIKETTAKTVEETVDDQTKDEIDKAIEDEFNDLLK